MDKELSDIEKLLKNVVVASGVKVKELFIKKNYKLLEKKDENDVLTSTDIFSEKYIVDRIIKKYPKYNILSEEKGLINNNSDLTFIIDPLDGTKEFVRGISDFNIIAGLEYNNEMVVGIVYKPMSDELYYARINCGAYVNNKKIHVSRISELSKSYIYTIFPLLSTKSEVKEESWEKISKLNKKVYRIRGMGNTNSAFCLIAKGSFEGYINPIGFVKGSWDILPSLVILKEAGGRISGMDGGRWRPEKDLEKGLVASNSLIHDMLIKIINK